MLEGPNEGVRPAGKMSADLAQDFSDFFINEIETIVNDITSKSVPATFKSAYVRSLLKKHNLDQNTLKNERPLFI